MTSPGRGYRSYVDNRGSKTELKKEAEAEVTNLEELNIDITIEIHDEPQNLQ